VLSSIRTKHQYRSTLFKKYVDEKACGLIEYTIRRAVISACLEETKPQTLKSKEKEDYRIEKNLKL